MAEKEFLGDAFLWNLRCRIAHRRELSRRWWFYKLAADALQKLLIKQLKLKYRTNRPDLTENIAF